MEACQLWDLGAGAWMIEGRPPENAPELRLLWAADAVVAMMRDRPDARWFVIDLERRRVDYGDPETIAGHTHRPEVAALLATYFERFPPAA